MTKALLSQHRLRVAVIGVRGFPDVIGGIETHCAQLYPALAAEVPEFEFVVFARRRYVAAQRSEIGGVKVLGQWAPRRNGLETLVHTPLAILRARFGVGARLLHLHAIGPGFFAPFARLLGMRVIVTHHAPDYLRPKWGWAGRTFLRWGERLAARFAHRIICVSNTLASDFLGRYPKARARTEVVRHGIPIEPTRVGKPDRIIGELGLKPGRYLLAVGRYDATKRLEELASAHQQAGPDVLPLVIVGSGDRTIEARLKATGNSALRLAGFRSGCALKALYQNAAALIHPSAMEGFGLVILEALAAGLPVRVSDIPVHREFGLPAGWHFPLDDADALTSMLKSVEPRDAPCARSSTLAQQYGLPRTVGEHRRILREVSAGMAEAKVPATSSV